MGVGIFWIGLNWADPGCWRLTLKFSKLNNIFLIFTVSNQQLK